jgi:hypothetical protein
MDGRIVGLTVSREGTYLELDNDPKVGPKDNVWLLKLDHANYSALFSLALAASANRWRIMVRIEGDDQIALTRDAAVRHIAVSWK